MHAHARFDDDAISEIEVAAMSSGSVIEKKNPSMAGTIGAGMLPSCEPQVLHCDYMFRERQGSCGKTGSSLRPDLR